MKNLGTSKCAEHKKKHIDTVGYHHCYGTYGKPTLNNKHTKNVHWGKSGNPILQYHRE